MSEDQKTFPPVAGMTVAQLLEAVALHSDMATYLVYKQYTTDKEIEANLVDVRKHYDRRAECMRELQRRFDVLVSGHRS